MSKSEPKVWFITGASTGLGRETVKVALDKGDIVIATLRKPEMLADLVEKWPKDKLHVLKLDVAQPSDITAGFTYAKEKLGQIDIVYNNAGVSMLSEVEPIDETEAEARKMFEINFWGALHVMQEAVKFMREVNPTGTGGRIFNVTSIGGITAPPLVGFYAASKHALEAVSESMAAELLPAWNIKITIIEPGGFVTSINQGGRGILKHHPAYLDVDGKPIIQSILDNAPFTGSPVKAAEVFWRLSRVDNPPLRLPLGKDSVQAISAWGEMLAKGALDVSSWSDDIAIDSA